MLNLRRSLAIGKTVNALELFMFPNQTTPIVRHFSEKQQTDNFTFACAQTYSASETSQDTMRFCGATCYIANGLLQLQQKLQSLNPDIFFLPSTFHSLSNARLNIPTYSNIRKRSLCHSNKLLNLEPLHWSTRFLLAPVV